MRFEQVVEVVETVGFWSRGKVDVGQLNSLLSRYGEEGFELVTVTPLSDGNVGTRRILLFFKREVPDA